MSNFTNQGTQLITKNQTTTTAQPDTVLSQNPPAGHTLPKGGAITLTLAKAPTTVHMVRVVGETPNAAANTLYGLNLNVREVQRTTHNPNMVGLVVEQYPTSNLTVKKGTVVTIWIGQAPSGSTSTIPPTSPTIPSTSTTTPSTTTGAATTTT